MNRFSIVRLCVYLPVNTGLFFIINATYVNFCIKLLIWQKPILGRNDILFMPCLHKGLFSADHNCNTNFGSDVIMLLKYSYILNILSVGPIYRIVRILQDIATKLTNYWILI